VAHGTPKVDSVTKIVTLVGALVLLAAVYYLVSSLIHTVKNNTTVGAVVENPKAPAGSAKPAAQAAASSESSAPKAEKTAASSGGSMGDASAGKAKYASCAACHGADGKGNNGAFPDLTRLGAKEAYDILKAFKAGDKAALKKMGVKGARYGIMAPNAAALSDSDMKNLAAYIAQLGGKSASAAPAGGDAAGGSSAKGDVAAGKTKYASCAACHGADGKGNHGAFPDLTRLNADEAAKILHAFKSGDKATLKKLGVKGDRYAIMAPNATGLSSSDIDNLAAYIAKLGGHSASASGGNGGKSAAAAAKPAAKPSWLANANVGHGKAMFSSCAVCHGNDAEGGRLVGAPKLAGMPATVIKTMLETYRKGKSIGPNSYYMFTQAKHLSDAQIADLAAYVGSLK